MQTVDWVINTRCWHDRFLYYPFRSAFQPLLGACVGYLVSGSSYTKMGTNDGNEVCLECVDYELVRDIEGFACLVYKTTVDVVS